MVINPTRSGSKRLVDPVAILFEALTGSPSQEEQIATTAEDLPDGIGFVCARSKPAGEVAAEIDCDDSDARLYR